MGRIWRKRFQSTPPRGRRHYGINRCCWKRCFNPRLHAGGDEETWMSAQKALVSIHASTREATRSRVISTKVWLGFNPRLHAGGDLERLNMSQLALCFNPRLHAGGDCGIRRRICRRAWFQSTPPRGRRLCW